MIYNQDVRLFSYWNVQFKAFPPCSVSILNFIFNVIGFWTDKHGKSCVTQSLILHVLVLQSLTFIGSMCCRSMGKKGRKKQGCKTDFVVFFFPSLTPDIRNSSEEFLPLHHSRLFFHSCRELPPTLSYEWDQEIVWQNLFGWTRKGQCWKGLEII